MQQYPQYTVSLQNYSGAYFDEAHFDYIADCKKWAKGRGKTYDFGQWHKYTVIITDPQGDVVKVYKDC